MTTVLTGAWEPEERVPGVRVGMGGYQQLSEGEGLETTWRPVKLTERIILWDVKTECANCVST